MGKTNNKIPITVEVKDLLKKIIALFLIVSLIGISIAKEKEKKPEQVEYLKIASVLIKDGYYDRAIKVLDKVNLKDKKVDLKKYYLFKGYAYYKLGNYKEAIKYLEKTYQLGNKQKAVILYLIDSYYKLKDCKNTIKWIDIGKKYTEKEPKFYLVKINCYQNLKDYKNLLKTLDEAIAKFPNNLQFYRIKFYTLLKLKLYAPALETANKLLSSKDVKAEDYIAVAKALINVNEYDKAIQILEKAYLKYPNNEKIIIALANAYYKKGYILTAAQLFEKAALLNPKYYKDAAELYRKAKEYYHALYLNSKVPDLKEKLKQKLAILLDMKRYDEIVHMEELLKLTGLLEEDPIKYAFAYAAFMNHDYEKAEKYLKSINDNKLFKKATQILAMIEKCKKDKTLCY